MSEDSRAIDLQWRTEEIGVLVLSRPAAANALNTALVDELGEALAAVRARASAKVLVIAGAGRNFCAGADLKEPGRSDSWLSQVRATFEAVADLEQVTIAAIHGACMGGGLELALACDLRLASSSATLGLPEILFGALPAAGGPARLARLVGPSTAKWLVLRGERVSGPEALRLGLINALTADEDLLAETLALAGALAERAGYGLKAGKSAIDRGLGSTLSEALAQEYALIDTMATPAERQAEIEKAAARSATYAHIFSKT